MCSIAALFWGVPTQSGPQGRDRTLEAVRAMNRALSHRGLDVRVFGQRARDRGYFRYEAVETMANEQLERRADHCRCCSCCSTWSFGTGPGWIAPTRECGHGAWSELKT